MSKELVNPGQVATNSYEPNPLVLSPLNITPVSLIQVKEEKKKLSPVTST
jgi:hypothetical protein